MISIQRYEMFVTRNKKSEILVNLEKLHIKNESGVGRNPTHIVKAIKTLTLQGLHERHNRNQGSG